MNPRPLCWGAARCAPIHLKKISVSLCLCASAVIFLPACEPEATPLPAFIPPAPTATPIPGAARPIRYAITAESVGFVPDLDPLAVEPLNAPVTADDLVRFDLIAGYGAQPGWTLSPITPHVALVVNLALPPLDTPAIADLVRRSIDPSAIVTALNLPGAQADTLSAMTPIEVRVALANAGYPDGFTLNAAHAFTPGASQVAERWQSMNLDVDLPAMTTGDLGAALDAGDIALALVAWTTPEERQAWVDRVGAENVIDLYTVPISFYAVEGLTITFTSGGFPLATR